MGECPLETYRRKRDPGARPSRSAPGAAGRPAPRFVVQRHAARRLHYDFRLERDGALASWAVPKGVPLEHGERHLAVHVEDHPLDYADFEGEIPAGQYGAGTVEIWDRGTYELLEEKQDGGLTVRLHGARLDGTWTLVPAHLDGDPKNWLLLRKDGRTAPEGPRRIGRCSRRRPTRSRPATAGRSSRNGTASARSPRRRRRRHAAQPERQRPHRPLRGRRPSPRPGRAVAVGGPRRRDLRPRRGGRSGFGLLQQGCRHARLRGLRRARARRRAAARPHLPGAPRRRSSSSSTPRSTASSSRPRSTTARRSSRPRASTALEGVVAKRIDSTYQPGRRSPDWRKLKLKQRQELVIAGSTRGKGRRANGIGALVLGVHDAEGLRYAGNVGTGLDDARARPPRAAAAAAPARATPRSRRCRRCRRCGAATSPGSSRRSWPRSSSREWTRDGRLRAPVYLGLRDDKPADDVVAERVPMSSRRSGAAAAC